MILSCEVQFILAAAMMNPTGAEVQTMDDLAAQVTGWEGFADQSIMCGPGPLILKNLALVRVSNHTESEFYFNYENQ